MLVHWHSLGFVTYLQYTNTYKGLLPCLQGPKKNNKENTIRSEADRPACCWQHFRRQQLCWLCWWLICASTNYHMYCTPNAPSVKLCTCSGRVALPQQTLQQLSTLYHRLSRAVTHQCSVPFTVSKVSYCSNKQSCATMMDSSHIILKIDCRKLKRSQSRTRPLAKPILRMTSSIPYLQMLQVCCIHYLESSGMVCIH